MAKRPTIRASPTVLVRIFPEDKLAFELGKTYPRETVADVVHRARLALMGAQESETGQAAGVAA